MKLFDLFNQSGDTLNDDSYVGTLRHIVGPWHQYDFTLAARGYGWDYMVDSTDYMSKADLMNIGTISVSAIAGAAEKECIDEYRSNDKDIRKMESLKHESGVIGLGGMSKVLNGTPVKIVWFNQTNFIRIMTPCEDEDFMIRYMETVIRRSFGKKDALKKGRTEVKRID